MKPISEWTDDELREWATRWSDARERPLADLAAEVLRLRVEVADRTFERDHEAERVTAREADLAAARARHQSEADDWARREIALKAELVEAREREDAHNCSDYPVSYAYDAWQEREAALATARAEATRCANGWCDSGAKSAALVSELAEARAELDELRWRLEGLEK